MTKFCLECGTKQRDDNTHFCSNCGFDFSKLENKGADSIIVPIDSDENPTVSKSSALDGSSHVSSSVSKSDRPSQASSRISNQNASSSTNRTSYSNSRANVNNGSDGLFSSLSFNKCFLAFAILLIFLFIMGMISNVTQTEPSSDYGLTSFMNSSGNYDSYSFLNDINDDSSYDNSGYNYLNMVLTVS